MQKHNVPVSHHAQQINSSDFKDFDYVIGMDESNVANLRHLKPRDSKLWLNYLDIGKHQTSLKQLSMIHIMEALMDLNIIINKFAISQMNF